MFTQDVLNHHLQSFSSGNVDEVMMDYTNDSVFISPDGRLTGLDEIRAAFEGFFSGLFRPDTYQFKMDAMEVEGDVAFIAWHSSNDGAEVPLGTDTFLIKDGKIVIQTFAAKIETS